MKLCECGCGNPTNIITRSSGKYKKGEYYKFLAGHNPSSYKVKYPNGCKVCGGENYWRGYCRKHCWEDEFIKKSRINSVKKYELTDKGKLARRKSDDNYIKNNPDKYKQKIKNRYKNHKEKVLAYQSVIYKYGFKFNDNKELHKKLINFEMINKKIINTFNLKCPICDSEFIKKNSRQKTCGNKRCTDKLYAINNVIKKRKYYKEWYKKTKEKENERNNTIKRCS